MHETSQPEIYIRLSVGINQSIVALIDGLQLHLQHPECEQGYIHRIRVNIKRLRAWLRLVRNKSGVFNWRATDHYLRDVAKKLSAKRDAEIILETLKWLENKTNKDDERSAIQVIRGHIQFDLGRHSINWETVKTPLTDVLEIIKRQTLSFDYDDIIKKGLKRNYKRTYKYGKKAFSSQATFDDLHQFRKWVKYLCYQLCFIQTSYPDLYEQTRNRLDKFGARLGRVHDLNLVKEKLVQLSEVQDCAYASKITGKMINKKLTKLLKRSHSLYRKVFTSSPSEFTSCIP